MQRIIYVEDDGLMGEMVKELLTEAGYLIGVVAHGTLAYETIAFKKPDLVILDRELPGMQGLEILKRLRATRETYLIPILMLTARGGEEMVDEGAVSLTRTALQTMHVELCVPQPSSRGFATPQRLRSVVP